MLSTKVKSLQKQLADGNEHPFPHHSEGKSSGGHNNVGELERVIAVMKKVIEKLQTENENLKKSSAAARPAPGKTDSGKKLAELQEENSKLKVHMHAL